ncbi:hypothetical protein ACJJTC_007385 [Scirpophaga incertulas]
MAKLKVQQGWLEGELLKSSAYGNEFYSFKGIPYATPPLGSLRFQAPQPAQPWEGVRQATKHGPVCPHVDFLTNQTVPGSEDCLYLNVYTPILKPVALLAVMVFIHGGAFKSGSGNSDYYGPDFLINHDIVLVTLNYRLDALGFLCLDTEEVPGNAGMKDQVLALKWVKENIQQFGGDPNNVTIFGESAGGTSCALHVLSPLSKGLFRRSIAMSGVPSCDWAIPFESRRRAFILGKQLGIDTNDPKELLEFLQKVPVDKLLDKKPFVMAFEEPTENYNKLYNFVPVIEKKFGNNNFLTKAPLKILKSGIINDVDIMVGYTNMEALVDVPTIETNYIKKFSRYSENFVPTEIFLQLPPIKILNLAERIRHYYFGNKAISTGAMKEFVTYLSESSFTYDTYRFLKLLSKTGMRKRFMYKFSCLSNRNIYGHVGQKYGLTGVSHMEDLMYLFNAKEANADLKPRERELIKSVCTYFTNFAKFGTPTPETCKLQWPEYGDGEYYGEISDNLTVSQHVDCGANKFWEKIFEDAGVEFFLNK